MERCKYKASRLIARAFEEQDIMFEVIRLERSEAIMAGFRITGGPAALVSFTSRHDENDVAVRIIGLLNDVPQNRRLRVLEACNDLNNRVRYFKFCMTPEGDVNVEYDLPVSSPDEGVGEMAVESYILLAHLLNMEYGNLMKALYSENDADVPDRDERTELMQRLREFRRLWEDERETEEDAAGDESPDDPERGPCADDHG